MHSMVQMVVHVKKGGEVMNKNKFVSVMKLHGDTQESLAEAIGLSVQRMNAKIKAAGFDAFISTKGGQAVSASTPVKKTIQVGSTVRVNQGAKTYSGGGLASFVYKRNHKVSQLQGDRAVITYEGTVVAAVHVSDLTLV